MTLRDLMTGRARERGSIMVLTALLSMILVGFVGLSLDGGEIAIQQRSAQNASDFASLAAARTIMEGGTVSAATTLAGQVAQDNGMPLADVTVAYYDASGNVTSTASSVATVTVSVSHTFPTLFLPVMGIDSASAHTSASAAIANPAPCAICQITPGRAPGINVLNGGLVKLTGGQIYVDSTSSTQAVAAGGNIQVVNGGNTKIVGTGVVGAANISPSYETGDPNLADPMASVPAPSVSGVAVNITCSGGASHAISPGVYLTITVPNSASCYLLPGVYVIETSLTVSQNGSLYVDSTTNGVMLYMTCATYPVGVPGPSCASGTPGASITLQNNASFNLIPPAYGTYSGLSVYADQNNTSELDYVNNVLGAITGTIYMKSGGVHLSQNVVVSAGQFNARIVVDHLQIDNNATLNMSYSASQNYNIPDQLTLSQ